MTTDVLTGSTLTLWARLVSGTPSSSTATFILMKDGEAIAREQGQVEGGEFADGDRSIFRYTIPEDSVPEDADSYKLEYVVEVDGQEFQPDDDFTVWPHQIYFKALDREGKEVAGFPFVLREADDSAPASGNGTAGGQDTGGAPSAEEGAVTGEDGAAMAVAEHPAKMQIVAKAPNEILEWVAGKEKSHHREAKVLLRYPVAFHSPLPAASGEPYRQFVNLPAGEPDTGKGVGFGREVTLVVGAAADKEREEKTTARKGDKVYVEAKIETATKRTLADPCLLSVQAVQKEAGEGETTYKGFVEIGDGGTATFKIDLGVAGGNACEVSIGSVEDSAEDTRRFVNWRKLWHQISYPAGATVPSMDRIKEALKGVRVDYEEYAKKVVAENEGPASGLHWFPGEWIDAPGKKLLNVGDYNKKHYHGMFADDHTPIGVHVMCCHTQYDVNGAECEKSFAKMEIGSGATVDWKDGSSVPGKDIWAGPGVFPKSFKDGTSSFRKGSWKQVGGAGKGTVDAADVWFSNGSNHGWVTVRLPEKARKIVEAGGKVELSVTLFVASGPYLGEADNPSGWLQLIVIKQAGSTVNDVMAHELGHTMNQVVDAVPPGLSAADHGRRYTGNGHQGSHCADGMSDDNYKGGAGKGDYAGDFSGKSECKCIMYGENDPAGSKSSGQFCARCQPFIQAEDLSSLH